MTDVIVIGSGPAGYVAAIRCAQLGLETICIEKESSSDGKEVLGGTCLNVGCIPSKALLDSSHKFYATKNNYQEHGISVTNLKLDLPKMMERKEGIVNKLTSGIQGLFKLNKVKSIQGTAKVVSANQVEVTNGDNKEIIEGKNIIIASGSRPIEIPSAKWDQNLSTIF